MADNGTPNDRIEFWRSKWFDGEPWFHRTAVHPMLLKHAEKLCLRCHDNKVLIPLCGKTVDMKWLYDQGLTVVGVECVRSAIEQFFVEHDIEMTLETVTNQEESFELFKSKDGRIRLYSMDMLKFSSMFEGTFDAVWDRGSLVALNREDVAGYVKLMKSLLKYNGRMLLESIEYDAESMKDCGEKDTFPPPYAMYEIDIRKHFGKLKIFAYSCDPWRQNVKWNWSNEELGKILEKLSRQQFIPSPSHHESDCHFEIEVQVSKRKCDPTRIVFST